MNYKGRVLIETNDFDVIIGYKSRVFSEFQYIIVNKEDLKPYNAVNAVHGFYTDLIMNITQYVNSNGVLEENNLGAGDKVFGNKVDIYIIQIKNEDIREWANTEAGKKELISNTSGQHDQRDEYIRLYGSYNRFQLELAKNHFSISRILYRPLCIKNIYIKVKKSYFKEGDDTFEFVKSFNIYTSGYEDTKGYPSKMKTFEDVTFTCCYDDDNYYYYYSNDLWIENFGGVNFSISIEDSNISLHKLCSFVPLRWIIQGEEFTGNDEIKYGVEYDYKQEDKIYSHKGENGFLMYIQPESRYTDGEYYIHERKFAFSGLCKNNEEFYVTNYSLWKVAKTQPQLNNKIRVNNGSTPDKSKLYKSIRVSLKQEYVDGIKEEGAFMYSDGNYIYLKRVTYNNPITVTNILYPNVYDGSEISQYYFDNDNIEIELEYYD